MEFFDELHSVDPPDYKTNECHFVCLGHFLKKKENPKWWIFGGALMEKSFDVIKYSQIVHR